MMYCKKSQTYQILILLNYEFMHTFTITYFLSLMKALRNLVVNFSLFHKSSTCFKNLWNPMDNFIYQVSKKCKSTATKYFEKTVLYQSLSLPFFILLPRRSREIWMLVFTGDPFWKAIGVFGIRKSIYHSIVQKYD